MSTLSLVPATGRFKVGETFPVTIVIDGTDAVNAVQTDISFPAEILTVASTDFNMSPFPIQAELTLGAGSIRAVRGAITPVSGPHVFGVIRFAVVAVGTAAVRFLDTSLALRASDTQNVLSAKNNASFITEVVDTTAPAPPDNIRLGAGGSR